MSFLRFGVLLVHSMIAFACAHCGRMLSVPDEQAGKANDCPHCGGSMPVPVPVLASEPIASPPVEDAIVTVAYVPQTATAEPAATLPRNTATDGVNFTLPGYEILGELGRGGMGVIYKARQLQLYRLVALKVILAAEHAGADALARFHSEAAAAARLSHPNIVPIYEVGEHNGRPFLTLEYVEGGNLAQKLSRGALAFREAVDVIHQLARAVDFAHQRGIIHRDLTPANILLAADGTAKITDFGLAKQRENMVSMASARPRTQSGAILGTPGYMAPEQASGKIKNISPATDVYGLGAILYECLTGRPPFQADSTLDILLKVTTEEPIPPRKLRLHCPRDLETIALKCLEKEPSRRYASAAALADDLQRYLDDKPIACRPPSRLERLRRTMRRRKELVHLFAGVLATLGIVLLFFLVGTIRLDKVASGLDDSALVDVKEMERDRLPPDLDLVPRNTFAFASLRLADLWKHANSKDLVEALAYQGMNFLPEGLYLWISMGVEAGLIPDPDKVERITFLMQNEESLTSSLVLLALRDPYDPTQLPKKMAPESDEKTLQMVEGKKIYHLDSGLFRFSFCPFNDRVLIIGRPERIRALLQENAQKRIEERPAEALRLAAGSHALVVSVRPTPEFFENIDETLSENKLASLNELRGATLIVDLPPPVRSGEPLTGLSLDLALNFANEASARPGLNETLEFVKHLMPLLESNDAPPELRPLTGSLLGSLRAVNWRQEGSVVRLALQLNWAAKDMQNAVRLVGARAVSQNKLKNIGLAMHSYRDQHGHFPPAAVYDKDNKPLYSWRVVLLPYLEQKALYDQFHLDEPWDSEHNKKLLAKMPAVYAAPWVANDTSMSGRTCVQVLVGPGAAFEGREGIRTGDFGDGLPNTLLIVEAAEAVPWTSPQDLIYQHDKTVPRLGGHLLGGFNAVMADATLRWIKHSISDKTLRAAITRNGGESLEPDWWDR